MKKQSTFFVASKALSSALLIGALSLAIGCPGGSDDGGEPEARPDVAEPEPSDGGEPDASPDAGPEAALAGETCAAASDLAEGDNTFSNAGATDDLKGGCDEFSDGAGGDVVLKFTLDAPSGVRLSLTGDFDSILYAFDAEACSAEIACTDAEGLNEGLSFPSLDAGTYFVVVDTFIGTIDQAGTRQDDGGTFTLNLELVAPFCEADQFDNGEGDNNTVAGAVSAGQANIDTADLDPETEGQQPLPLSICEGDVDYFAFFHMGGEFAVTTTNIDGGDAPTVELFSATVAIDDDGVAIFTEGAAATAGPLDRGAYLAKISASTVPATGVSYSFAATHGCQGDTEDSALLDNDDDAAERAPTFGNNEANLVRAMCDTDKDGFLLNNLLGGTLTLTATGGAGFGAEVFTVDDGDMNTLVTTAYTTDVASADSGSDFTVTLTDAPAGRFLIVLNAGTTSGNVDYNASILFSALENPPANDLCAGNIELVLDTPVVGQTLSATHTLAGPQVVVGEDDNGDDIMGSCNGDAEVITDSTVGPAGEAFYHLNVAADIDVQIDVDGSDTGFSSAVYILEFTGVTCPADLTTLNPVQVNSVAVCETGVNNRVRVPSLPAGDYLVVVDGVYNPPLDLGFIQVPEGKTQGIFSITAKTFADGFPPPEACVDATAAELPTAGTPATFSVDFAGAPVELKGGCGGNGAERVFTLSPSADVTLKITVGGGEGEIDTVAYIAEASCSVDAALAATDANGMCNDDGEGVPALGSLLEVTLTGGVEYFLIVDAYSDTEGTATVTLEIP